MGSGRGWVESGRGLCFGSGVDDRDWSKEGVIN